MLSTTQRNRIYIEAGILTLVVYLLALFLNGIQDNYRIDALKYKIIDTSINFDTFFLSEEFYNVFNLSSCDIEKENIIKTYYKLKKIGQDLTNYGQLFLKENANQSQLKEREFILDQIKLYLKVLEYDKKCNDTIIPIIYFFDSLNPALDRQSLIIEQFAINNKNKTIVLPFDYNFNKEPFLNLLKSIYNIKDKKNLPFFIMYNITSDNPIFIKKNNLINLNNLTRAFVYIEKQIRINEITNNKTRINKVINNKTITYKITNKIKIIKTKINKTKINKDEINETT